MTREEFIKQRCEIDKITEEKFEETYRVVKCNCGMPYCKGYRCVDLDGLLKQSQQLKDNWNKLKEYIGAEWYSYDNESVECEVAKDILNKMRKLEQGSDSNE